MSLTCESNGLGTRFLFRGVSCGVYTLRRSTQSVETLMRVHPIQLGCLKSELGLCKLETKPFFSLLLLLLLLLLFVRAVEVRGHDRALAAPGATP